MMKETLVSIRWCRNGLDYRVGDFRPIGWGISGAKQDDCITAISCSDGWAIIDFGGGARTKIPYSEVVLGYVLEEKHDTCKKQPDDVLLPIKKLPITSNKNYSYSSRAGKQAHRKKMTRNDETRVVK